MRSTPSVVARAALFVAIATSASMSLPAAAQVGEAAAIGVASSDAEAPRFVALTAGLAERVGTEWHYVCPAVWGGPPQPRTASTDSRSVWVFGDTMPAVVTSGAVASGVEDTVDLPAARVRDLAIVDGRIYVLVATTAGTDVLELRMPLPRTIGSFETRWDAMTSAGDELVLGTASDESLVLARVKVDGTGLRESRTSVDGPNPDVAALRAVGEHIYAIVETDAEHRVLRLDGDSATQEWEGEGPVHGPFGDGDATRLVGEGRVWTLRGETGFESTGDDDGLRCATATASGVWVCRDGSLFALVAGEPDDDAMFEHDRLVPPAFDALTGRTRLICEAEWLEYADRAGVDPRVDQWTGAEADDVGVATDVADVAIGEGCTCGVAVVRGALWPYAIAALLFWRRRAATGTATGTARG